MHQRILHLPNDILKWVDNLITLVKQSLNIKLISYDNQQNHQKEYIHISKQYYDELLNGIGLCVLHLKMIINHHNANSIQFLCMEDTYINKFFRVLNNLCIIIIFMKNYD